MHKFSGVIISNNEEDYISQCISSLQKITDDIVIVDSGSTDKTKDIASALGARVYEKEFTGYGDNKNYGNAKAKYDWIISIDGDEVLSPTLISTLQNLQPKSNHIYALNSLVNHSGKWIRHSGWYPKYKNRIFNKKEVQWNDAIVHEDLSPQKNKTIIRLHGDLWHYSYKNKKDHIDRNNYYAQLKAKEWQKSGKSINIFKKWFGPSIAFIKTYVWKLGILDGELGLFIAKMDAQLYQKALRLYFAEKNK